MRTANPALAEFTKPETYQADRTKTMTLTGTATATGVLLGACVSAAIIAWGLITNGNYAHLTWPFLLGGGILGFVLGLVISFNPKSAPFLGVPYAIAEGVFLAAFSLVITQRYLGEAQTGIIFQAIGATFAVMAAMLVLYLGGVVRVSATGMKVMMVALGGLMLYAVVMLVGNLIFGAGITNLFASASPIGIGFTVLCIVLASFFLVLDFQFIEAGIQNQAPKYMEWYGAFGLMVTLVWLYIEMLRLLAKLRR